MNKLLKFTQGALIGLLIFLGCFGVSMIIVYGTLWMQLATLGGGISIAIGLFFASEED